MGYLIYNHSEFHFSDRELAHLQVVVSTKLRRREAFLLSWTQSPERGGGVHSLWVVNGVSLRIVYEGSRLPAVNHEWLEGLMVAAGRAGGLRLMAEPPDRS